MYKIIQGGGGRGRGISYCHLSLLSSFLEDSIIMHIFVVKSNFVENECVISIQTIDLSGTPDIESVSRRESLMGRVA